MKITAEIEVKFDGDEPDLHDEECAIDPEEMADEIAGAVSGCDGIESVASVEVKKLTLRTHPNTAREHSMCVTNPAGAPNVR